VVAMRPTEVNVTMPTKECENRLLAVPLYVHLSQPVEIFIIGFTPGSFLRVYQSAMNGRESPMEASKFQDVAYLPKRPREQLEGPEHPNCPSAPGLISHGT
jgi:hypothetical protein